MNKIPAITPEEARVKEMLGILKLQRDQAADACVSLAGELAAANARWNDIEAVKKHLAEFSLDKEMHAEQVKAALDGYSKLPRQDADAVPLKVN